MPKRIRKPPSKKGGSWVKYAKKGLELGAIGAVQFVPGLDVAADAALAGEAVEGAEVGEAAVTAGKTIAKKGGSRLEKYAMNYAQQQAQGYANQAMNYAQQVPRPYRQPVYSPRYREPMMPPQLGAGYREPYYPPPKKPLLGPLEKKILLYGLLFVVLCIIVIIVIRVLAHSVDGYYHSSTGSHCKKNNHCGSHKKHRSNCGSHTKNGSGHNSCGGS